MYPNNWLQSSSVSPSVFFYSPPSSQHLIGQSQPDVILEIGPPPYSRYLAHSQILAQHSGYLRSLTALPSARLSADYSDKSSFKQEKHIFVPNVTSDQFVPLLRYMYTGFLDLNMDNIFGVLLATHILHMPPALEICRNFLSRLQAQGFLTPLSNHPIIPPPPVAPTTSSLKPKILRPIPNKPVSVINNFITPPSPHINLPSSETTFKSFHQPPPPPPIPMKINTSESVISTTSALNQTTADEETVSKVNNSNDYKSIQQTDSVIKKSNPKVVKESVSAPIVHKLQSSKIIIDVASCDGPVRFRRVLNESYSGLDNAIEISSNKEGNRREDLLAPENRPHADRMRKANVAAFHQQMARNITEVQHSSEEGLDLAQNSNPSSEHVFTCVYCDHTFKSEYCYLKHAKRHLNPLMHNGNSGGGGNCSNEENQSNGKSVKRSHHHHQQVGNNNPVVVPPPPPSKRQQLTGKDHHTINDDNHDDEEDSSAATNSNRQQWKYNNSKLSFSSTSSSSLVENNAKRDVIRPLDMNVQYYPCKTCGSKFPSYYFVHKHRKLCHQNEEEGGSNLDENQQQQQPAKKELEMLVDHPQQDTPQHDKNNNNPFKENPMDPNQTEQYPNEAPSATAEA